MRRPHSGALGLEAGEYRIEVQAAGHAPFVRSGRVSLGKTTDLGDGRLEPGTDLRVRVVDARGAPVPGARVEGPGWGSEGVATDVRGEATVSNLAPGPATLEVAAEGFLTTTHEAVVAPAAPPTVVALARGARVLVRIRASGGEPARGALVVASPVSEDGDLSERHTFRADVDGRIRMHLAPGRWRFSVPGPGEREGVVLGESQVAEGDETSLDLALR